MTHGNRGRVITARLQAYRGSRGRSVMEGSPEGSPRRPTDYTGGGGGGCYPGPLTLDSGI